MALWDQELTTGCFAQAEKDEPMFVLLSRDALAPWLVRAWALLRTLQIWIGTKPVSDYARCDEARALARDMRAWRKANRPKQCVAVPAARKASLAKGAIDAEIAPPPVVLHPQSPLSPPVRASRRSLLLRRTSTPVVSGLHELREGPSAVKQ